MRGSWLCARWERLSIARRAHEIGAPLWIVADLLEVPVSVIQRRGRRLRLVIDGQMESPFPTVEQEQWTDAELRQYIRDRYSARNGRTATESRTSSPPAKPTVMPDAPVPEVPIATTPPPVAPVLHVISEASPATAQAVDEDRPAMSDCDDLPVHVPDLPWIAQRASASIPIKRLGSHDVLVTSDMTSQPLDPAVTVSILDAAGIEWSLDLVQLTRALIVMLALGFQPGSGKRPSYHLALGGIIDHAGQPRFFAPPGFGGPMGTPPPDLSVDEARRRGIALRNQAERLEKREPRTDDEYEAVALLHAVGLTCRENLFPSSPLLWHDASTRKELRETLDALSQDQADGPASAFWWHKANRQAVEQVLTNLDQNRAP